MNRVDLGLLAEDALRLGVGYALLFALGLVRSGAAAFRFVGLAYLAGWALQGTLLSLMLMAGIALDLPAIVVAAALAAAVCVAAGRPVAAVPDAPTRPRAGMLGNLAALAGGAVIAVASAAAVVTGLKSEWDPNLDLLTAWLPRSGIVYYFHGLDPVQWSSYLDPWYPPLVPAMYASTFEFAGGFHPSLLMAQNVVLGIAFVLGLAALLDRVAPRWLTFPTLALLITAPWFWWRLTSLLPDQTLGYMIATAGVACLLWLYEGRRAWLGLATVFLCAATLVKLEGLAFSLSLSVAVIAVGFVVRRRRALPSLVLLLGPLATVPWRIWLDTHSVAASNSQLNTSQLFDPSFLTHRIHRLTYSLEFMLKAPWHRDYRTAALIVIAMFAAIVVAREIPSLAIVVAAWLVLSFVALVVNYWSASIDVQFYVTTSASRVGGVIIISAAAVTPLLLGAALRSLGTERAELRPSEPAPSAASGRR